MSNPEPALDLPDLVPARMLNEFAYCPRLAWLEWVQGDFADSADTVDGRRLHRRVDRETGALPAPADLSAEEDLHPRSVYLSASGVGLTARIDLVEAMGTAVTPVDYKRGEAPDVPEGAWEPERVQLCAQGLVLEENGSLPVDASPSPTGGGPVEASGQLPSLPHRYDSPSPTGGGPVEARSDLIETGPGPDPPFRTPNERRIRWPGWRKERRQRRSFTDEFKAGGSLGTRRRENDCAGGEGSRPHPVGSGRLGGASASGPEQGQDGSDHRASRAELAKLKNEVREVRMAARHPKNAAAFFAKEST